MEPCAGSGAIIRAVNTKVPGIKWSAVEQSPDDREELLKLTPRVVIGDFLAPETLPNERFDGILTNPPFRLAEEILQKSMSMADYVILLLRVNFLESESRVEFMRAFPPDVYVLPNRPSFSGPNYIRKAQTDSIAYGFFVWGPKRARPHGNVQVLASTSLDERKADPTYRAYVPPPPAPPAEPVLAPVE